MAAAFVSMVNEIGKRPHHFIFLMAGVILLGEIGMVPVAAATWYKSVRFSFFDGGFEPVVQV
jgi:hypothetical protein